MTSGRRSRSARGAVLLAVLSGLLPLAGCTRAVDGVPTAVPVRSLPGSVEELEPLIVTEVPSGLPRLEDGQLHPPAGAKRAEDVAGYAENPARERQVLEDYGYRHGWERFWGDGSALTTGVFVDQFHTRAGAGAYAEDLAHNDAEHYDGVLEERPVDLPGTCRLLTIEKPRADSRMAGPAALVWCAHGVFSVGVTAVAGSVEAAEEEVRAVLDEQLDRLPPA
ncbi:DUF7373 family lipoprotein [Blastococcus mobilis]|uniref:DUF7373 domain-containing protein n=1 Tax=Blastococcus mobilis TaxID=1938746 RepID=A0A238WAD2_9ACTN|nr:hypothetical protein [Blastococcus mobilis]SNR43555.1 hypothetical protein SAMN06272737_10750 [Blastococcus mobilis]